MLDSSISLEETISLDEDSSIEENVSEDIKDIPVPQEKEELVYHVFADSETIYVDGHKEEIFYLIDNEEGGN